METGASPKQAERTRHWTPDRACYTCADGEEIRTQRRERTLTVLLEDRVCRQKKVMAQRYCVAYEKGRVLACTDTPFCRDMGELFESAGRPKMVVFPGSTRRLGERAFRFVVSARAVDLSVTTGAFADALEELHRKIGYGQVVSHVRLPDWLREIGDGCFVGARITRFTVPRSVETIGKQAFASCMKLRELAFQEGCRLRKIDSKAFTYSGLRSFVAPAGLRTLRGAFYECLYLRRVALNEGLEVLGAENDVGVFQNTYVEEVLLPSTLKRIWDKAFLGCHMLRSIRLPEGLQTIGRDCFSPGAVEKITLPGTLREIEDPHFCRCFRRVYAREGCAVYQTMNVVRLPPRNTPVGGTQLGLLTVRDVRIPSGVEKIGSRWFYETAVETVAIPESVTEIGEEAFFGCRSLRRVALAETSRLEVLGRGCFSESALEDVWIPPALKEIGEQAFYACERLETVRFSTDCVLWSIGQDCFAGSGLLSLRTPASLRQIEEGAFAQCERLELAELNDGLNIIGKRAFAESGLRRVSVPSTVRAVGPQAFYLCQRLTEAQLAHGLETLCEGCFSYSGLEEALVPASVRTIEADAFRGCQQLRRVEFADGSRLKHVGSGAFSADLSRQCQILFPPGFRVPRDVR